MKTKRYVKFIDIYYLEDDENYDVRFTCETQGGQRYFAYLPRGSKEPKLYTVGIIELQTSAIYNFEYVITSIDSWGNGDDPSIAYFGGNTYRNFRRITP